MRERDSYLLVCLTFSCFIGRVEVLAGALLAPVLAVIAFNIVIFVTVMSVLIKHSKKKIQRAKVSTDGSPREATIRLLISIFSIMNMYGLTWLFAIFTFTDGSFAFQLLFAIFNSLQGFFMFIFFCVLGKEARDSWAHVLCRGKLKKFAPNISSSRPGAPRSSTTPSNTAARRYSAQTTNTLAGISSQSRRSSYSDALRRSSVDTLRRESVSSYRAEISEEPSSISIAEDNSSIGADLIEFNDGPIAADTLARPRPSLAVTPMLTLHEEEEESELTHSPGVVGDAENQGNAFTLVNEGAASYYYGETTLTGDALQPPSTLGGDSASVSGASLAESGIMIDDELSDSGNGQTPSPSRELQQGARNMPRSSPPVTNDDDGELETEDNSEVVMNPHAH